MKKLILNNWPYKLLAILVAFVVWFVVVQVADPQVTARFNVPITFTNESVVTDEGEVVTNYESTTVTIRVTKERSVINKLSADSFYAEADFSKMYRDSQVPITVTSLSSDVSDSDIELEDQSVGVTIEKLVSVDKVIDSETKGSPASGYAVGMVATDPSSVTITCPESFASTISSVKAIVDVEGISEESEIKAEIEVFDGNGKQIATDKIPGFSLNGNEIVTCKVSLLEVQQTPIKVSVQDVNEVASGYAYTGAATDPTEVSLSGDKETLANLKEIVIDNISVSGLSETTTKEVDIRSYLPDGVKLQNSSTTIKVTINISKASEKTFEIASGDIKMENVPDGYSAKVTSSATVTIASSEEKLATLSSSDITASVDLSGLSAGTHSVTLNISFKEDGYTVKDNAQVTVIIY